MTYTYDDMLADMESRGLLKYGRAIGFSAYGRRIIALSLGGGRKKILLVGTHHGREYISAAYLVRTAGRLIDEGFPDGLSFSVVPMLNPDGAEICQRGGNSLTDAMELVNGDIRTWKANGCGIDLNRHYPCLFEKKRSLSNGPSSEGFGGIRPATEPEVRALMAFSEAERFDMALTFHAKGEEILYGDTNTHGLWAESLDIAKKLAASSGYAIAPPSADPASFAAGFENWFRERFSRPCLLIELAPYDGSPVPYTTERFDELVWSRAAGLVSALYL